jgi:hypothetical protein
VGNLGVIPPSVLRLAAIEGGIRMASDQILAPLVRFSIVVTFNMASRREIADIPAENKKKRPPSPKETIQ